MPAPSTYQPTWVRKGQRFSISRGLIRSRATEVWGCEDLQFNATDYAHTIGTMPMQHGSPHPDPDLPGALVVDQTLIAGPRNRSALVMVQYDSLHPFRGGPRPFMDIGPGDKEPLRAPIVFSIGQNGVTKQDWDEKAIGWRDSVVRQRTVFVTESPDKVAAQIEDNFGKLYTVNPDSGQIGYPYSFSGGSIGTVYYVLKSAKIDGLANGYTRVNYFFWRNLPVGPISKTVVGSDFDLPPLPSLHEYSESRDPTTGLITGIGTITHIDRYRALGVGGALPGLPETSP